MKTLNENNGFGSKTLTFYAYATPNKKGDKLKLVVEQNGEIVKTAVVSKRNECVLVCECEVTGELYYTPKPTINDWKKIALTRNHIISVLKINK